MTTSMTDAEAKQRLDKLSQRIAGLGERKRMTETELKRKLDAYEARRKHVRETYGTDDVQELKKLLEKNRATNAEAIVKSEQGLQAVEQRLNEIAEASRPQA